MISFVFYLFLWGDPNIVSEYRFYTMEACQEYRAHYVDTHPSDPEHWQISRCRAKGK